MKLEKREITLNEKDSLSDACMMQKTLLLLYVAALENAKKALADANGTLKTELEDKIDDANEALEDAIGEIKGQLDAVKKDLEEKNKSLEAKNKNLEEKNNELTRKVDSLNTTVIIVAVVSGIGVCGTLGVGIWFFIDKKRSLFK